jgi:tetratricopeptide (TPR) repeat protein
VAFYYNQGANYYDKQLFDQAILSFKKSININPRVAVVHFSLASAYIERKMIDKAIEEYKKTIEIEPGFSKAYLHLSRLYSNRGMYEEALNELKRAKVVSGLNPDIKKMQEEVSFEYAADCLNRSTDAFLAQDKQKAYALLNRAVQVKPDFAYTHYVLAQFYFLDHNYKAAEEHLQKTIEISSEFWLAHKLLGDIYFNEGKIDKTISQYKKAISLNNDDPALYNDLGIALIQLERYNEAITYLKEASRIDPNNLNIRYSLASVHRDNSQFNEAISEYQKIVQNRPDYPHIHNDLGDIYYHLGLTKDALEEYNKEIAYSNAKLSTNPSDPIILNNLAYALNAIGSSASAKEAVAKAINLQPDYQQAYLTLAKICEREGKLDDSILALNKAKSLSASTQTNFIDRDVARLRRELSFFPKPSFLVTDTVYLKNGRSIKGKIKEEDDQKVILEVQLGNVLGNLTFYRDTIERIEKIKAGKTD